MSVSKTKKKDEYVCRKDTERVVERNRERASERVDYFNVFSLFLPYRIKHYSASATCFLNTIPPV